MMIDALMKVADEDEALALSELNLPVQAWLMSEDVVKPPDQYPALAHQYLEGYYCVVSMEELDDTIMTHPGLQIAFDRERAAAGQPCILKRNITEAKLQDLRFEPVFMGSELPWGNWKLDAYEKVE